MLRGLKIGGVFVAVFMLTLVVAGALFRVADVTATADTVDDVAAGMELVALGLAIAAAAWYAKRTATYTHAEELEDDDAEVIDR